MAKLDDDITWHRDQIARLGDAIEKGEPGTPVAKGPAWGPKARSDALPDTIAGMRKQLARYEQTLLELEEQRGRGD
ncbi:MAG: hypothetical protein Q8R02_12320 [Hyphomonadaceae bacterium]|nr:hypothetical protein [Hyphomonadaceae bacterium]